MDILDDFDRIESIDKSGMWRHVNSLPGQFSKGMEMAGNVRIPYEYGEPENIVVAGMGGSATSGDILKAVVSGKARIPVFVSRSYGLPFFCGKKTLLIASSYSGNTEETIHAFGEGVKKECMIVAVSSGGKIADLAREHSYPLFLIPSGMPPRAALGYSFSTLAYICTRVKPLGETFSDLEECSKLLERMSQSLSPRSPATSNLAKQIAQSLKGFFPVIYGAEGWTEPACVRWRGQLAENAKVLSSVHILPEMNHNEIVGWKFPEDVIGKIHVILLRDGSDRQEIQKRFEVTKEIVSRFSHKVSEVWAEGESDLAKILSIIYIGDFVSVYLAYLNGTDPTPVANIDYLKKKLAGQS